MSSILMKNYIYYYMHILVKYDVKYVKYDVK